MDHLVDLVKNRLSYWVDIERAPTIQKRWAATLRFIEPSLPSKYQHFGDLHHFPPRLDKGEYAVVFLNHQSDMDGHIAMSLMNTEYIKRQVYPLPGMTSSTSLSNNHAISSEPSPTHSQPYHPSPSHTLRPIAFTLSHFSQAPIVGPTIAENFILLYGGITDDELERRIRERLEQGYNTFVLLPEGGIYDMDKDLKAKQFWYGETKGQPESKQASNQEAKDHSKANVDPYPFHQVFAPRSKCWSMLLNILGPRLRYLCDLTVLYPDYKPWRQSWNYDHYPSLVHAMANPLGTVFTHTKIYDLWQQAEEALKRHEQQSQANEETDGMPALSIKQAREQVTLHFAKPETLMRLWLQKEKRMEWLRAREIEFKHEHEL